MTNNNTKGFDSLTLQDYLEVLPEHNQVKKWKDGYVTNCLGHEDRKPSLAITPGRKRIMFKCFAGCDSLTLNQIFNRRLIDHKKIDLAQCSNWSLLNFLDSGLISVSDLPPEVLTRENSHYFKKDLEQRGLSW